MRRAQVVLQVEAFVDAVGEREQLGTRRERQFEVVGVRVLDGETLKPLPADVQRATQNAGPTADNGDDL